MKKAIILAGGLGTRLYPITKTINKQLLPLYNKPIIAYPLQTIKEMGYRDILIIAGSKHQQELFEGLLDDGSNFDLNIKYEIQDYPKGLVDAFIIGEEFIKDADEICLILGDNIIIANTPIKTEANTNNIFVYNVQEPSKYGVVKTDKDNKIVDIVEKPTEYVSNNAVVGLYIFTKDVITESKKIKPSRRGELEIVDLIKNLNKQSSVVVNKLDGFWFDVGDFDSLLDCSNLIRTIKNRSNIELGLRNL